MLRVWFTINPLQGPGESKSGLAGLVFLHADDTNRVLSAFLTPWQSSCGRFLIGVDDECLPFFLPEN